MSDSKTTAAADRWLHGPASDLLLGSALVYLPLFALLLGAGTRLEAWIPMSLMPLVILAFNTPHIGATLLRVYEREDDRRAYQIFALYLTLLLVGLSLAGLYVPVIGSVLITLYVTVIPWHFTGQNYGIAVLFLRRRGVELDPETKRPLYLTFILTYAITFVALHGDVLSDAYAPLRVIGTQYRFFALGIPGSIVWFLLAGLAIGYVHCVLQALSRLRAVASWGQIAPAVALMGVQALWYAVPILIYFVMDPSGIFPFDAAHYAYTFTWITQIHAVQYLWVSSYFAQRRDPGLSTGRYFGRALLAGTAVYGVPALLLAPGVLGSVPFDGGLFIMLAGALNLHHVLLDSAIWKLRSSRVASVLLRPSESVTAPAERAPSGWRPLVWASGTLGLALMVFGTLESHFGSLGAIERKDLVRLEQSSRRLAWMGRESPNLHESIAVLRAERGDLGGALEALERAVSLQATDTAWVNIGRIRERSGDLPGAIEAYREAAALAPDSEDVRRELERALETRAASRVRREDVAS
ncbi:MAG: hypothetical protein AAF430_08895 [Myxococcota bacterium]